MSKREYEGEGGIIITVKKKDNKVKVVKKYDYMRGKEKLLTLKNTGNGYHVKHHTWSCTNQDEIWSMDYSAAFYLMHALVADMGFVIQKESDEQDTKSVEDKSEQDGWITWNGGLCPIPLGAKVGVKFRTGACQTNRAGAYYWGHDDCDSDIIAYHIVKED